jgi:hypothetical protein
VPEWGEDPLKKLRDVQEILADPLGERKAEDEKLPAVEDKSKTGSKILLDLNQERRNLIQQKYNRRISEEQYFKL